MVMFIVGLILHVLSIAGIFFFLIRFVKDRKTNQLTQSFKYKIGGAIVALTVTSFLLFFGVTLMMKWEMEPLRLFIVIAGCICYGLSIGVFLSSFVIHYYKKDLVDPISKHLKLITILSGVLALISFFTIIEGYAPYLFYPLAKSIVFTEHGIDFARGSYADSEISKWYYEPKGYISIAFYGICILGGAILVYFICDHHFYKEYHRHGMLDVLFVVSFLSGIAGARLWFCFVLEPSYYFSNPLAVFRIQDGGLAIQGGALVGIAVGVSFVLIFMKYVNIRKAVNMIVPCILIAQSIGRWGNFFNHEVYGAMVDPVTGLNTVPYNMADFWWLPTIVRNQMATEFNATGVVNVSTMWLPLFFIESITNMAGYFIIYYAIRIPLKKHLSLGDLAGCYVSWYGLTRIILEPLRYNAKNGFQYDASYFSAWGMLIGGFLIIIALHIYDAIRWKKFCPVGRFIVKTFKINVNYDALNNPKNPYYVKPIEENKEVIVNNG